MSELIAFEIYRIENIAIKGESFTVRFTKRRDKEEYELHAANDSGTKNWKGSYSSETAADFAHSTGRQLEEEVYAVLKGDIDRGSIQ